MRRLFSLKTLILVILAAGIGAIVALVVNQKKKFAGMSEEEIRSYLDAKLAGKMSEEQLGQIQDAVVAAVKRKTAEVEELIEEAVDEAVSEEETVVEVAIEEATEDVAEEAEPS